MLEKNLVMTSNPPEGITEACIHLSFCIRSLNLYQQALLTYRKVCGPRAGNHEFPDPAPKLQPSQCMNTLTSPFRLAAS